MAVLGRRRTASGTAISLSFLVTLLLSLILLSTSPATAAATGTGLGVIGIDLGTEYLKAALVKPGVPLEIVLTKDSKRKEAAAVAFKPARDSGVPGASPFPERFYGGNALALAGRFPDDVYMNLKTLLGIPFSEGSQGPEEGAENVVDTYKARYPATDIGEVPERGTVGFKSARIGDEHGKDRFLVEELLAMQLKQVKANAEGMGSQPTRIRDAVITFPAFYTAEEKRSIELAAELAGLDVLAMVSDGVAVGLNYATSRTFPSVTEGNKPEYHVIYDMGAGSTTTTVLRFQSRTVKDIGKFNKTVQEIQVMGTGWDKTLGGDALNQLIVNDMVEKYIEGKNLKNGATPEEFRSHGRTMAKLWKEAERVRQILSANSDTVASFEGLFHEEVNFKYKISRSAFEKLAAEHASRVATPLTTALGAAKLKLDDVESIILHGGAIRTPFVQKQLESACKGSSKLRTNVNADEAAVFGAAFKGAALSPSFRVKEIRTNDTPGFAVGLKWNSGDKDKQQKLFTPTSEIGAEKQITMKNLEDFEFSFYQQFSRNGKTVDAPVLGVKTKNLTESVATLKDKFGCVPANITTKFTVRLSPVDGLPELMNGAASCEVHHEEKKGVVEDVKEFFGFGSKDDAQKPLSDAEAKESITLDAESSSSTPSSEAQSGSSSETTSTSDAPKESEKPKEVKVRVESIPISFTTSQLGIPAPSATEMKRIKDRLAAFDASDLARVQREEVFNSLESFIYRAQDLVTDEEFIKTIAQDALSTLKERLSEASDWLYGDGSDATAKQITEKLDGLKEYVDPALKRQKESSLRPSRVESLKQNLSNAKMLVGLMQQQVDAEEELRSRSSAEAESSSTSASDSPSSVTTTSSSETASESPTDEFASLEDETTTTTSSSSSTSTSASSKPTPSSLYSAADISSLSATHDSINTWLEEQLERQEKLRESDDPAFTVADIDSKLRELEKALNKILTKMGRQQAGGDTFGNGKGKGKKGNGKKDKEEKGKKEKGKEKDKPKDKKKDVKDEL